MNRPPRTAPLAATLAGLAAMAACALPLGSAALAGEIDLLATKKEQKKYGAYVGVFGGGSTSQEGDLTLAGTGGDLSYDVPGQSGDLLMGIEVGYSWRTRYPLEFSLEFEGLFSSTEVQALLGNDNAGTPLSLSDVATAKADMNYAAFFLNGAVTLDLRKLKGRLGPYITRVRPYAGAGLGGAQIWFRNTQIQSVGDLLGVSTSPSSNPFETDQFVFAYQWFGGVQIQLTEKLAAYGEYRQIHLEKVGELDDYSADYILGGLQLRY